MAAGCSCRSPGSEYNLATVCGPADSLSPACRHWNGCASARLSSLSSLHDILLADGSLEAQGSLALQLPHDGDDLLLRRFHFLDFYGAHYFHVLLQHLGAALRHGFQEVVPELLARALQRHSQHLAVHAGEHLLDPQLVDQHQVLEYKHEMADRFHQVGIGGGDL